MFVLHTETEYTEIGAKEGSFPSLFRKSLLCGNFSFPIACYEHRTQVICRERKMMIGIHCSVITVNRHGFQLVTQRRLLDAHSKKCGFISSRFIQRKLRTSITCAKNGNADYRVNENNHISPSGSDDKDQPSEPSSDSLLSGVEASDDSGASNQDSANDDSGTVLQSMGGVENYEFDDKDDNSEKGITEVDAPDGSLKPSQVILNNQSSLHKDNVYVLCSSNKLH